MCYADNKRCSASRWRASTPYRHLVCPLNFFQHSFYVKTNGTNSQFCIFLFSFDRCFSKNVRTYSTSILLNSSVLYVFTFFGKRLSKENKMKQNWPSLDFFKTHPTVENFFSPARCFYWIHIQPQPLNFSPALHMSQKASTCTQTKCLVLHHLETEHLISTSPLCIM